MTAVDVVVPWSQDVPPERVRNLRAVVEDIEAFGYARIMLAVGGASLDGCPEIDGMERHLVHDRWNKSRIVNRAVMDLCTSPWIMMLDSDILLDHGLREAFERMIGTERTAIRPFHKAVHMGPEDTEIVLAGGKPTGGKRRKQVGVLGGGCVLVRRDVFLRMRGYDERYVYMEDTDFNHRAQLLPYVKTGTHPENALHLWHPPVSYDKQRFGAMFKQRKHLSANTLVADTESCIPRQE